MHPQVVEVTADVVGGDLPVQPGQRGLLGREGGDHG